MFIELPLDDGIVRIEEIDRIDLGKIEDSGITIYEKEVPDTHYIIVYMKQGSHCTQYQYLYASWELMYNELSMIKRRLGMDY